MTVQLSIYVGVYSTPLFCMIWLRDFSVCLWYLPHTCFAQIARPSASRFIRVFDDGGNEVLSVDVSTSTDALYSNDTLTITTSTSFFTNRMYYILAGSGVCVCVCMQWAYVHMHVCVREWMCSCERADGQADMRTYLCACVPICHACLYHCIHLNCTCRCRRCYCSLPN